MKGNASSFSAESDELSDRFVARPHPHAHCSLSSSHSICSLGNSLTQPLTLLSTLLTLLPTPVSHWNRVRKVEVFVGSGMVSAALKVACVEERES